MYTHTYIYTYIYGDGRMHEPVDRVRVLEVEPVQCTPKFTTHMLKFLHPEIYYTHVEIYFTNAKFTAEIP